MPLVRPIDEDTRGRLSCPGLVVTVDAAGSVVRVLQFSHLLSRLLLFCPWPTEACVYAVTWNKACVPQLRGAKTRIKGYAKRLERAKRMQSECDAIAKLKQNAYSNPRFS